MVGWGIMFFLMLVILRGYIILLTDIIIGNINKKLLVALFTGTVFIVFSSAYLTVQTNKTRKEISEKK